VRQADRTPQRHRSSRTEESGSFLKKRTKKLLIAVADLAPAPGGRGAPIKLANVEYEKPSLFHRRAPL
jgi:hypothetical protein